MPRTVPPTCIEFIRRHESCRLVAYLDQAGVWTIGVGHTGPEVCENMIISQGTADALFERDLERIVNGVDALVPASLNRNQFAALVSLAYNIGLRAFRDSTLLKHIHAGALTAAAQEFARWNRAGGKPNAGLILRRAAERELFEEPVLRLV